MWVSEIWLTWAPGAGAAREDGTMAPLKPGANR